MKVHWLIISTLVLVFLTTDIHSKEMSALYLGTRNKCGSDYLLERVFIKASEVIPKCSNIDFHLLKKNYINDRDVNNDTISIIKISQLLNRLGINRGIYFTLSRFEETYTLRAHVISPYTYKEVYTTKVIYSPASMTDRAVEQIVEDLDIYFEGVKEPVKTSKVGYYSRLVFPGWAQGYHNYRERSNIYQTMFVFGGLFIVGSYANQEYRHAQYLNYRPSPSSPTDTSGQKELQKRYGEYKGAQNLFYGSLGFMAFVYTCNFIDGFLFSHEYNSPTNNIHSTFLDLGPDAYVTPTAFSQTHESITYGGAISVTF
jgi:hypothetical protein